MTRNHRNGEIKHGICPRCKKEKDLTTHHVRKRLIFGNNGRTLYLCRSCHDELEILVTVMENVFLREFGECYEALSSIFIYKEDVGGEDLLHIIRRGFSRIRRKRPPDLEGRISDNVTSLLERKRNNGHH